MNTRFNHKLTMCRTVQSVCEEHPDIVGSSGAFAEQYAAFKLVLEQLDKNTEEHSRDIKGVTRMKRSMRSGLQAQLEALAGALGSLAAARGDHKLLAEINYSPSRLKSLSAERFLAAATILVDHAVARAEELIPYGINAEMISALPQTLNLYREAVPSVIAARDKRKSYSAMLAGLMNQADNILHNHLDKAVKVIALSHPDFYTLYHIARKIHGDGSKPADANGGGPVPPVAA